MRVGSFLLAILVLHFLPINGYAQGSVDHWETVFYDTSDWKYIIPSEDLGSGWILAGYDDSSWLSAKGGFGYGDGDDGTVISNTMAIFMRKEFTINNLNDVVEALVHVDFDDGFIAYINGIEIGRENLFNLDTGEPLQFPQFGQSSNGLHEALLYRGIEPRSIFIDTDWVKSLLLEGTNIFALQVHNDNLNSSDLTARGWLSVGLASATQQYGEVPSWFTGPLRFESSNLPILKINTNGLAIQDENRIVVDMEVIDNGPGMRNNYDDVPNGYVGKASIEYRGESSLYFAKRSYSFETQLANGENNNVEFMGLPEENDWILHGPYSDKSLIRNFMAMKLARDMGRYASRTKFLEVAINDQYQGLYMLMEKIKRDSNRVDIAKVRPEDIAGDELTGGYILRVDKWDENDYPDWTIVPNPRLPDENLTTYQYNEPEGPELVQIQKDYIQSYVYEFESSLSSADYRDPSKGYAAWIGEKSFVDFMLVNEVSKNVDAYIFSTYMFKEKDSNGGKLKMGPVWDFNLGFGNVDYHPNSQFAPGWMYDDGYRMYWFRRLMSDPNFQNRFTCRYRDLRNSVLSTEAILNTIDSTALVLEEAATRNFKKYNILGTYVWPNQFVGNTYQEEIDFMKNWIVERLNWMDGNLPETCEVITSIDRPEFGDIRVYPNPSAREFRFVGLPNAAEVRIQVVDLNGREIMSEMVGGSAFTWDGASENGKVNPGIYIARVFVNQQLVSNLKLVKTD